MQLRLALASLAVSGLIALAIVPGAAAAPPPGFVGMTAEDVFSGNDDYRTSNLSAMAAVGVRTIRQTFDAAAIERAPGVYDFSYHDRFVAKASAHGIRVLPVLFDSRRKAGHATCPPRDLSAFAGFARAVAQRYGRGGSLWRENPGVPANAITAYQIWNEPSLAVYWCRHPNARSYVAMLRVTGGMIKGVDGRARIVTAGIPSSRLAFAVPMARYIDAMYRAGARRWFDSLGINPYPRDLPELTTTLANVRSLMNRHGDRRGRLWITELGWGDRGPRHRLIVGEAGQARRVRQVLRAIGRERRRLRLDGFVYFMWRDAQPYPPLYRDGWGLHTGLLTRSGRFKPAFRAFRDAVGRIR